MNIVLSIPLFLQGRPGRACQHEAAIWDFRLSAPFLGHPASFLRDRNDVSSSTPSAEGMDLAALLKALEARKPDLIIATVSTPTIHEDLNVSQAGQGAMRGPGSPFSVSNAPISPRSSSRSLISIMFC